MASLAATLLLPRASPWLVSTVVPAPSSCRRIRGMLRQLAALHAAKGTRRPASGGRDPAKL